MKNDTYDFNDGNGPVPAHRHENSDGSVGGWVADTATVDDTVLIGLNAQVYGNARVAKNAQVFGYAKVCGDAKVYGNARVAETWPGPI